MKRILLTLLIIASSFLTTKAQVLPVNQMPWDSIPYITNDQMVINKSYGASRYQLSKITLKQFFKSDSLHQNKLNYGQDSIRVTINRDTIKTTLADSNSSTLIFLTPLFNNASLYVSAIHTGQYFVVKSTAWTKHNLFNWSIINNP